MKAAARNVADARGFQMKASMIQQGMLINTKLKAICMHAVVIAIQVMLKGEACQGQPFHGQCRKANVKVTSEEDAYVIGVIVGLEFHGEGRDIGCKSKGQR